MDDRFAPYGPLEEQLERIEGEERQAIEDLDIDLPEIPEGDSNEDEEREWLYDRARLLGAGRALPQGTGQRLALAGRGQLSGRPSPFCALPRPDALSPLSLWPPPAGA